MALSGTSSLAARSVSILTLLVIVPFASAKLEPDLFGLWMIVSGFGMIFGIADLGVGGSVINAVAQAAARDDIERMRIAISNGFAAVTGIAVGFAAIGTTATLFIDWQEFLSIKNADAVSQARPAVIAFLVSFALQIPISVIGRVQAGLQRTFLNNIALVAGNISAFFVTLIGLYSNWQVPELILALFLVPVPSLAANYIIFFYYLRSDIRPKFSDINRSGLAAHLRTGLAFFGLQLGAIALIRFDAIIVANRSGLAAGGIYSVLDRIFALTVVFSNAFLGPLWPAYREAIIQGDRRWWTLALIRSTIGAMSLVCLTGVGIILLWPLLSEYWLKSTTAIPIGLLAAVLFLRANETGFSSISMFLNGAGMLRFALFLTIAMAIFGLSLKLLIPLSEIHQVPLIGGATYFLGMVASFFYIKRTKGI